MDDQSFLRERIIALIRKSGADESPELFLTIENTVEDRVHAYTRLLRMKQVLRKSQTSQ